MSSIWKGIAYTSFTISGVLAVAITYYSLYLAYQKSILALFLTAIFLPESWLYWAGVAWYEQGDFFNALTFGVTFCLGLVALGYVAGIVADQS
jgi:hypothetical protein